MSVSRRAKRKKPRAERPSSSTRMADTITTPPPSQLSSLPLRDHAADALPRYQTLIDTAASLDDGWFQRSFPAFRRFHRKRADRDDAVEVDIRYAHASQLNDRESDAVFSMTKANMQHLYDACDTPGWSWDDQQKRLELTDTDARFLLAIPHSSADPTPTSPPPLPIGFLHLRYLLDNELPVLYAYELQLLPSHQRVGLGSCLMNLSRLICAHCRLSRVTLTVFRYNQAAVQLYRHHLGFTLDDTSPDDDDDVDYHILSRINTRFTP